MSVFNRSGLFRFLPLILVLSAGSLWAQGRRGAIRLPAAEARRPAVDFPDKFKWLGTDQPLSLAGNLKGHVVVLDFWTYCCINCIHILPDLEYLEHKYKDKPVAIVGVHSAKFATEQEPANIEQAMKRYRIAHAVLVDQEFAVWNEYGAQSWPTFAVIDSSGRQVGNLSGEGHRENLDQIISALLEEGEKAGTLAAKPFHPKVDLGIPPLSQLAFPGKVLADAAGKRLFIADSNHDRIIVTDLEGKHQKTIGAGEKGSQDGSFAEAKFFNPQGMALVGQNLYVTDTDNHTLRKVDLAAGKVSTVAGNGKQAYDRVGGGKGTEQGLSSPWDVIEYEGKLFIAMAGTHQIWRYDPETGISENWVGTGGENLVDEHRSKALLAQPSGLAIHDGHLYFADSEISAVRRLSFHNGFVETLIGKGLFHFGFQDGTWSGARFQHCLGVAPLGDDILVADTYNNALRVVRLKDRTVETLLGGPDKMDLDEPAGLSVAGGLVYIADTNHHRIVRFDPATGKAQTLQVAVPAH